MCDKSDHSKQSNNNDLRKQRKSPEFQQQPQQQQGAIAISPIITRERSFVRSSNQNANKRRSLAFNVQQQQQQQQSGMQLRGKPAMDIYRPPNVRNDSLHQTVNNKLNANAMEFTTMMSSSNNNNTTTSPSIPGGETPTSNCSSVVFPAAKTPANMQQQQMQYMAATSALNHRRQAGLSLGSGMSLTKGSPLAGQSHRPILITHSHPMQSQQQIPLMNSPSSGNILQQSSGPNRVKFAVEPQKFHNSNNHKGQLNNNMNQVYQQQQQQQQQQQMNLMNQYNYQNNGDMYNAVNISPLQRSKSLSSADALTRGIAVMGLALSNDVTDIGQFPPEIQKLVDGALTDPNQLNSRSLMELTSHFIKRAVEGRRYALPISKLCLNIIAKEQKETFLEALLNTCRQWYQEREKLLFTIHGMKSPSRLRFTAFMAFLTEMFCQLKRRQLQLRTQCEGAPPPLVLLTLLSKCCEDCVRPPVRSLSEIECLFYVLTCIGHDMELQLPQQLELLLSMVRDAFLNANDAAPAIRRTLLQLIELQASHWQLPGNTVLYYYPSSK